MSIASASIIAELNISVWIANKVDRGASDNVNASANADKNAAKVRKDLMAGTGVLKNIERYAAACRVWHNICSVPWSRQR